MAISLKHAFTSNVADSGNTSLVQPSNWNAEHTLTAAADTLLGAVTSGPVTEISCTSAGRALLDDADAAAQRTTLGLGSGDSPTFTGLTLSGVGQFSAGTALLPSISTSGDLNTGMWFPAADTIAWSTDGSERLRISSTGSITASGSLTAAGWSIATNTISTTSSTAFQPQISLVNTANDATGPIWTTDKGRGVATPANSGDQLGQFLFRSYNSGGVASNAAQMQAISAGTTATGHAGQLRFVTRNTSDVFAERMRIDGAGNLGINTTTPDALLTVNGAASFGAGAAATPSIAAFGDLNTGMWFPAADTIAFSEGGAESMRINSSGFLGVGTTTIPAQVSVVGTGQAVTTAFDTAGSLGGSLLLGDAGAGGGSGGAIVFSAVSTAWRFAAIKGNVTNGGGNTQGNLSFYVRNAAADATLTRAMVISPTGILGVGGSPIAGVTVTANRNLTGSVSPGGFVSNGVIQSDATTLPTYFSAQLNTAAGSYTVANPQLFRAVGGNIGAGSAITNLYGYVASALTAGTNNYNFHSSIVAANVTTGKTAYGYYEGSAVATGGGTTWAFYGAGTAPNHFNGNVGLGTTTFGTSAAKVLAIGTGTAPSSGPADTIQIYSTDLSAGNTMLSLYTEGTVVNANATADATHRIAIRVNGTVYYLLANTSA